MPQLEYRYTYKLVGEIDNRVPKTRKWKQAEIENKTKKNVKSQNGLRGQSELEQKAVQNVS